MKQEIGRLAREGIPARRPLRTAGFGHGVVLGRDEDLGRLFGHLSGDGIDATVQELRGVRAFGTLGGPRLDRRPQGFEPPEPLARPSGG